MNLKASGQHRLSWVKRCLGIGMAAWRLDLEEGAGSSCLIEESGMLAKKRGWGRVIKLRRSQRSNEDNNREEKSCFCLRHPYLLFKCLLLV
jgi:hypothetical protein